MRRLIGRRIRRIRLNRGLTQQQLVEGIYERSYLSLIERGKIVPSAEALNLFAQRLRVDSSELTLVDEKAINIARGQFQSGVIMHDTSMLESAWKTFNKFDASDDMIKTVQEWAKISSSSEVLQALRSTIKIAEMENIELDKVYQLRVLFGNCYFNLGRYQEAVWTYKDILNDCPPLHLIPRVQINLGSALMELEEYSEAIEVFLSGIKHCKEDHRRLRAYLGLGRCYRYLNYREQAMECFEIVEKQSFNVDGKLHMFAKHAIAVLMLDSFQFKEAMVLLYQVWGFYKAGNMKQHEAELIEEFVRLHFYQGEYEDALRWCDYAFRLVPDSNSHIGGRFLIWKSRIYRSIGEIESAENAAYAAKIVLKDRYQKAILYIDPALEQVHGD
ncbi:helix-turn-helix domain-containing protein [Alicyclobacillus tolerans]|uniref:helix-turn-helix domain-containing protein n=1 Tax=Alicyclobacillus tolerans TaxID=90970 RepID=UPI0027D7A6AD|nr:helix-turn-helix transcriptional regulator [Alicyclobacillus tengchongensis]